MNIVTKIKQEQHGFILESDIAELMKACPNERVLIRTGQGRFTCQLFEVRSWIRQIASSHSDYVRDVSFIADSI